VRPSTAISIRKRGTGSYIPPALQERILHRHFIGQSMPTISREEHRDFGTVAKVLRNNPARLREHLEGGRAAFYALTTGALETIRRAMENGDAEMAYRLLTDCGEVPQPGQIPGVMESENFETPETSDKKKHVAELVELANERGAPSMVCRAIRSNWQRGIPSPKSKVCVRREQDQQKCRKRLTHSIAVARSPRSRSAPTQSES
jgi:hypothetical protein